MITKEEQEMEERELEIKKMKADFRLIAEYAEALRSVTGWSMDGCQEAPIVDLTLHKILELAERNIK